MKIINTEFSGLKIIHQDSFKDKREGRTKRYKS